MNVFWGKTMYSLLIWPQRLDMSLIYLFIFYYLKLVQYKREEKDKAVSQIRCVNVEPVTFYYHGMIAPSLTTNSE